VNQSSGPLADDCAPLRVIFMRRAPLRKSFPPHASGIGPRA
jgi:hypothetical protein